MTPTTGYQMSNTVQYTTLIIAAVVVVSVFYAIKLLVDRANVDHRAEMDRLAAHTFCADHIAQVADVAAVDATLPQFGRRAVA